MAIDKRKNLPNQDFSRAISSTSPKSLNHDKAKKPFPSVNNVLALRRQTFTFKYHSNLCKQKAQISVRFNFRREFT